MPLEVRRDEPYRRKCRLALAVIVLSMPVALAAMALTANASIGVKVLPTLLWLASSAIIADFAFVRPLKSYRCPQCQRPLPRAEEARPWFRFRCEPCGVEWDVERSDGEGGGGE
jgi:hypothetical protein